jgi:hypothetical protein
MNSTAELKHEEISLLAHIHWQQDGCPPGRDLDYWLRAEAELKETWRLLAREYKKACQKAKSEPADLQGNENARHIRFSAGRNGGSNHLV